jgi:hypothetical protein
MPQHLQAANLPFRSCALHLSFIIYHFFAVDIPNLKPILNPMCIGTHSAVARQASPKEAPPPLPRFFHHSKFKILNSPPPFQSGPIKANQIKNEEFHHYSASPQPLAAPSPPICRESEGSHNFKTVFTAKSTRNSKRRAYDFSSLRPLRSLRFASFCLRLSKPCSGAVPIRAKSGAIKANQVKKLRTSSLFHPALSTAPAKTPCRPTESPSKAKSAPGPIFPKLPVDFPPVFGSVTAPLMVIG